MLTKKVISGLKLISAPGEVVEQEVELPVQCKIAFFLT